MTILIKTLRNYIDIINEANADGTPDGFQFTPKDEYDALPKVDPHQGEMLPGVATLQGNAYMYQGRPFTIKPGPHRSDADMVKTTDGKTIWLNSEMTGSKTFHVAYLK
jgi:hypothetical protein